MACVSCNRSGVLLAVLACEHGLCMDCLPPVTAASPVFGCAVCRIPSAMRFINGSQAPIFDPGDLDERQQLQISVCPKGHAFTSWDERRRSACCKECNKEEPRKTRTEIERILVDEMTAYTKKAHIALIALVRRLQGPSTNDIHDKFPLDLDEVLEHFDVNRRDWVDHYNQIIGTLEPTIAVCNAAAINWIRAIEHQSAFIQEHMSIVEDALFLGLLHRGYWLFDFWHQTNSRVLGIKPYVPATSHLLAAKTRHHHDVFWKYVGDALVRDWTDLMDATESPLPIALPANMERIGLLKEGTVVGIAYQVDGTSSGRSDLWMTSATLSGEWRQTAVVPHGAGTRTSIVIADGALMIYTDKTHHVLRADGRELNLNELLEPILHWTAKSDGRHTLAVTSDDNRVKLQIAKTVIYTLPADVEHYDITDKWVVYAKPNTGILCCVPKNDGGLAETQEYPVFMAWSTRLIVALHGDVVAIQDMSTMIVRVVDLNAKKTLLTLNATTVASDIHLMKDGRLVLIGDQQMTIFSPREFLFTSAL